MSKVKFITPLTAMTVLRLLHALFVFVSAVATALLTMWSGYVYAGIVTINFPGDLADPCVRGCILNTTADGFRISPEFNYSANVAVRLVPFGMLVALPGIGWDAAGPRNPNYLGTPSVFDSPPFLMTNGLYIDHDGLPFGLLSIESLTNQGTPVIAESSKGAIAVIPFAPFPPPLHFDFVGPEWRDIQWVTFFGGPMGFASAGFNQLVTFVPGPPTLGLLGLGVLILGWHSHSLKRTSEKARGCRVTELLG